MALLARGARGAAAAAMLGALFGAGTAPFSSMEARADDARPPPPAAAQSGVTGPGCWLGGTEPVGKGLQIFDAASGGRVIGSFSGTFVALRLSDFPADPATGRARVTTSLGSGSVRLDGWVAPATIPVYTARDLPVMGGHVWISTAQKVKLVQAATGSLTGEITILGTSGQTARASGSCDAFTLQRGTPSAMEVPGNGRGYLMKTASLDLFDDANGSAVFALKMSEGSGQLFWSTESRAGFVHVKSRSDLTLDAWARQGDLEPLKKGEMMDQFVPPTTSISGAQLALDPPPRVVKATREIPIRIKRDAKDQPVGAIEIGAEVYVLETITGWSNILPKSLALTPPDDGGFWIPSSEVP
ncbi:MAG: hypothetical protein ABJE95_16100 [Byssovorax sp.]